MLILRNLRCNLRANSLLFLDVASDLDRSLSARCITQLWEDSYELSSVGPEASALNATASKCGASPRSARMPRPASGQGSSPQHHVLALLRLVPLGVGASGGS